MKRIDLVDGLRGYFLVFMVINHLVFDGGYWLVFINHRQVAFVEDAQGFVFLSGLLIGMVYARKMQRGGFWQGAGAIWRRARELYLYAMGVLALILTLAVVIPHAADAWRDRLGDLSWSTPRLLFSALTLLFQPTYMDILPQYIVYMLAAPPLIWLSLKGRWPLVLIGSGLFWLAAQFGVHRLLTGPVDLWLAGATGSGIRAFFNLLGWQFIFIPAMVFGILTSTGQVAWTRVFRPDRTLIPLAALSICLFFVPFRIALTENAMPAGVFESFHPFENRADFGLVYLLNFAAAASGVAWLLIAGPHHPARWVRCVSAGLGWLFSLSFLRLIGRHSLYVYVWHVVIVYMVGLMAFERFKFGELTKTAIALSCIGLLALPALWRERPGSALDQRRTASLSQAEAVPSPTS